MNPIWGEKVKRLAKEPAEYCEGYCEAYQRVCEILISPAAKIYGEFCAAEPKN